MRKYYDHRHDPPSEQQLANLARGPVARKLQAAQQYRQIRELIGLGFRVAEISELMGLSEQTVRRARSPRIYGRKEMAFDLFQEGRSVDEVSTLLGLAKATAYGYRAALRRMH